MKIVQRKSRGGGVSLAILFLTILLMGCSQEYELPTVEDIDDLPIVEEYVPVTEEKESEAEQRKILGRLIDEYLIEQNFSGVVLISRGGEIVLREAYGMANRVQNIENTVYTPFHIASITKQMTGAAIITLIEDGYLDLNNTLDMFFPEHENLDSLTLAHLLTMSAGFHEYTPTYIGYVLNRIDEMMGEPIPRGRHRDMDRILISEMSWTPYAIEIMESLTIEDLEAYILSRPNDAAVGRFSYSNSDYILLGRIIDLVSGMAYEEYVKSRLFAPVRMLNSGFLNSEFEGLPARAYGHCRNGYALIPAPFVLFYSTGGAVSTVDDLSLWLDAYFGGSLFDESMLDQVFTGENTYNKGWFFIDSSIWVHPGAISGFNTMIIYERDSDTKIIMLSNEEVLGNLGQCLFNQHVLNISEWVLGERISHMPWRSWRIALG